ncbi:hypothetical protein [Nonomuraea sp. GTA35]|uniref:hypothetical protein n=1 Tax=Nonomuraea sp. GTA35 TaxID=1676746 RepID=UPI0035C16630
MTMASTNPQPPHTTQTLTVLEHTYPGWNISGHQNGMWSATRDVTPTQADAGMHAIIVQPNLLALAAILSQQLEIVQRVR